MGSAIGSIIYLVLLVAILAAYWRVLQKANQPGWGIIIPIYNLYLILKITGHPWWWILLMLIPVVNIILYIIVMLDLAKVFGKGTGFGVGLIIPLVNYVCIMILGFGDAQYLGPAGATGRTAFAS